ncbi:MAG: arginine decarboxylase [Candidatus Paceibacteria bacterium]|jgi:arginine decarboxylase
MSHWTPQSSRDLFNIENWGLGHFGINQEGHVEVMPDGPEDRVDLHQLVEQLKRRGVETPLLLRFDGLLRARVRALFDAFEQARIEFEYPAPYQLVYPIKVNQERGVVESLLKEGRSRGMGLEIGSKPELIAVMTLRGGGDNSLVICNGYKDEEYIELALLAQKIGITAVIVIEKFTELETVLRKSEELGIRPVIGVRTKLSYRGSGRWSESGGHRSKFGLATEEIVALVERLRESNQLDCLRLLHFHLGSQITSIRSLKTALTEATHTLTGITALGAKIEWFDVGGGLGVDYDGSRTSGDSSMNYSLQEYANDVVYQVGEACRAAKISFPTILTESGRALSAHHAVLVTEVLGVSGPARGDALSPPEADAHEVVHNFYEVLCGISAENAQEAHHDLREQRERARMLFNTGQLTMPERASAEAIYWKGLVRLQEITWELEYVPDEFADLERDLADIYFLNFSLFQSLPDSWAIEQLFPVLPIQRLDEEPTRRAVLADITCDSDGKIDRFISLRGEKRTLEVHTLKNNEPYYMGIFLAGAYQEILGDMHNLFGDTNVVHVDTDGKGQPRLHHVVRGERVQDVLAHVEYFEKDLLRDMRRHLEESLERGLLTYEESAHVWRRFESALNGYTYLSRESASKQAVPILPPTS